MERLRYRAIQLGYFTVAWTAVEALVAFITGIQASSTALVGFGLDSVIEMIAAVTVLWRFKQERLADQEADNRAARIIGITFFVLAAYIGYEAVADLVLQRRPEFSLVGTILAAVAFVVMTLLAVVKKRLARILNSRALSADSLETLACAYLSAVVLVALALNGRFKLWWADPAAALGMAVFMVREGIEAVKSHNGGTLQNR